MQAAKFHNSRLTGNTMSKNAFFTTQPAIFFLSTTFFFSRNHGGRRSEYMVCISIRYLAPKVKAPNRQIDITNKVIL